MRFYRIVIQNPETGQVIVPPGFEGLLGGASYTSFVNGKTLPAAWDVELDIPVIGQATPQGQALARVWGISRQEISQANNLNGKNISIYGGMQKGLPLANPAQAGLLVQGVIFQAFGNWIDIHQQTLDFVIMAGSGSTAAAQGTGTLKAPKNLVLNWKAGTTLAAALTTTLQTAFPGVTVNVNINSGLIRPNDEIGFYPTLEQLSQYARETSLDIIKTANYAGVSIVIAANTITVSDGSATSSAAAKQVNFQDLIDRVAEHPVQDRHARRHLCRRSDHASADSRDKFRSGLDVAGQSVRNIPGRLSNHQRAPCGGFPPAVRRFMGNSFRGGAKSACRRR